MKPSNIDKIKMPPFNQDNSISNVIDRVKIANGYYRKGYGRTSLRKANIYLINGLLYAKDKKTAYSQMHPLDGELEGYVRVNKDGDLIYEVSDHSHIDKHLPYTI